MWREDPTTEDTVFQYTRHNFGSKDSPSCANYALQRTAADNQSESIEASEGVHFYFHMDHSLESSQTVEQATLKAQDLVKLLNFDIFTLTKFATNVPGISYQLQHGRKLLKNDIKVLPTVGDLSHV